MRAIAIIIAILGLAGLVFGILFVSQAGSAEQEVAGSLTAPVTLDNLDATYDGVNAKVKQMPPTDPQYLTYFAQRTSLGLARSNVGTASFARTSGLVNIFMGLGLVLVGIGMLRKIQSAA